MPTHSEDPRFRRDFAKLGRRRQAQFLAALRLFIQDLERHRFRPELRVKRVVSHPGVWELTWGHDDRATFQFGAQVRTGEAHVIWRRIGTHDIFRDP